MAEWSIIPNDGASINSEGVATFQPNSGTTDREYTITYTDDNGCSGSTTYIVSACTDCQCTCDDLIFDDSQISLGYNETTKEILVSGSCGELTFQKNADWINVSYANDRIIITANENAEPDNREAVIKVLQDGIECNDKNISIEQQGKPRIPRLVFSPGTDVYWSFERKPDENSNLLRANEELIMEEDKVLRVLITDTRDKPYEFFAEERNAHYVYLAVMGKSFPVQEEDSLYDCEEEEWYNANPGYGSPNCMQLGSSTDSLVACPYDPNTLVLSTMPGCGDGSTPHIEFDVEEKKILMHTFSLSSYPFSEDRPFKMRSFVSKTGYKCAGNRESIPSFEVGDDDEERKVYEASVEFYVKK